MPDINTTRINSVFSAIIAHIAVFNPKSVIYATNKRSCITAPVKRALPLQRDNKVTNYTVYFMKFKNVFPISAMLIVGLMSSCSNQLDSGLSSKKLSNDHSGSESGGNVIPVPPVQGSGTLASVNFDKTNHFEGNILGKTGINLQTGATLNGRMLAQTAVTLEMNTVSKPF